MITLTLTVKVKQNKTLAHTIKAVSQLRLVCHTADRKQAKMSAVAPYESRFLRSRMTMPSPKDHPKPRFAAIPGLLFAVGLGLMFYYGDLWYRLPSYSEAEIEQSVEINLALAQRRQYVGSVPDSAMLEQQRVDIRSELTDDIALERHQAQGGTAAGLVLLAMGFAQMMLMRRLAAR